MEERFLVFSNQETSTLCDRWFRTAHSVTGTINERASFVWYMCMCEGHYDIEVDVQSIGFAMAMALMVRGMTVRPTLPWQR